LIRENLERYKNEQPVINSEQQLSGKVVDEEVIGALQRTGYITLQHMMLIDSVLTFGILSPSPYFASSDKGQLCVVDFTPLHLVLLGHVLYWVPCIIHQYNCYPAARAMRYINFLHY
jgi:hypothetical protein